MERFFIVVSMIVGFMFMIPMANAVIIKQTMDGAVDVSIEHPDSVIIGKNFTISLFVQNNGWEDKQDIEFQISSQDNSIMIKNQTIAIPRLSKGGSFGQTLEFTLPAQSQIGTHYLNALYSQVLLSNNETPLAPTQKNIAIPILIKRQSEIQLNTITPSSIFPNAEFPFDVEVTSKDIDLKDVIVEIAPPTDVVVRGQTMYSFSAIEKNNPTLIHTQIVTNPNEITYEHKIPFEIKIQYTDDTGEQKNTSKTVNLLLRPRTFMEFTTDGGVWLGDVFLAPYVSVGTLIGIPAGTIFSLMIKKLQKKKTRKKK